MPDTRPAIGPAPDREALREAALKHLSRYAATEAGLVRVLDRRIDRWVRASGSDPASAAAARAAARDVAHSLVRAGAVDDAAFATARAARLIRSGRSRRAAAAHLAAKGVDAATAQAALADGDELLAAVAFTRRRRLGAFAVETADPEAIRRALGALARAGFPRDAAERALRLERAEAEDLLRRGRE